MADFLSGIQANARAAEAELADIKAMPERVAKRRHLQAIEYRVDILRAKLVSERMDHNDVENVLNDRAAEGWALKQIVDTEVLGRFGPGGTDGLMLVFERPGPAA